MAEQPLAVEVSAPGNEKLNGVTAETLEVRDAFAELDNAVFTKSHMRAVVVAGTGFLTDSYGVYSRVSHRAFAGS